MKMGDGLAMLNFVWSDIISSHCIVILAVVGLGGIVIIDSGRQFVGRCCFGDG